jgi:integrase
LSGFSSRPVVVYDLPLVKEVTLLHPEQAVLRFGDQGTVDVGALCYLRRDSAQRRKRNAGRKVDRASFNQKRADRVGRLIGYCSEAFAHSGRRATTLRSMIQIFIGSFMDWVDANGHVNVLDGEPTGRAALRDYITHLRECVLRNSISINTGAGKQSCVLDLLSGFLDIDDLHRGINLLRRDMQAKEPTRPPCEANQSKVLALCGALFEGFTELVLGGKRYPFRLMMPKYLDWPSNDLWIFPTHKWCLPPHRIAARQKLGKPYWAYDYVHGRLATIEELLPHSGAHNARGALCRAQNAIAAANADLQNRSRRDRAMVAHHAFVLMFIANTGMNLAQVLELRWNGDYEAGVERQGFRAIKGRAGNKAIHFEITAAFLPKLKHYLELRAYLLKGAACDHLFFSLRQGLIGPPNKMRDHTLDSFFFIILRLIDPQLPRVTPRQWRAAKSDWLIRNEDPATAALVLQNSEHTILRAYAAGSESAHLQEMSEFFARVADLVVNKGQPIGSGIALAVGACAAFGKPSQVERNAPIIPDCKRPEGCLFCDKFRVHADERDTRKLLSCRYCIQQTSHLAATEEQFQRLFNPILDRIQAILDEVDRREAGVVERIRREVEDDGELDPYWAAKLEMLMNLELV